MKVWEFHQEEEAVRLFLDLPSKLYSSRQLMQDRPTEQALLSGVHFLNQYVTLTKFLVVEGGAALARCVLTEYPGEDDAYFGFFECVEDPQAARLMMQALERRASERGHSRLVGPLDVSIWVRYRLKVNLFDGRPYAGEPWNLAYYPQLLKGLGYEVMARYASNSYQRLPRRGYELPKYRRRYEEFLAQGYEIRSPRLEEWDRCVREVYGMVSRLYTGFHGYHPVTEEEFVQYLSNYRHIVDVSLIKLAYYQGRAVGFFMGVPNYHNLASRKVGPGALLEVLVKRVRAPEYVLLYMGVEPEHRGLGKALVHSIMAELAKKRAKSVGALIREGNPNYDYAAEVMGERYQYELLEKRLANPGLSDRRLCGVEGA